MRSIYENSSIEELMPKKYEGGEKDLSTFDMKWSNVNKKIQNREKVGKIIENKRK